MWKSLFLWGLQCLPIYAQITFSSPSTGQMISGGSPFTVACGDSSAAPYFSQMSNFSIALFAGSYSSPQAFYAWDLSSTSPATVSNSITIPSSIGPSDTSYFLGISGWLILNDSISVTYFSPQFTLTNMTGSSSALSSFATVSPTTTTFTSSSTTVVSVVTASAGRLIICEDSDGSDDEGETGGGGGVVDSACESAALSIIGILATATRTIAIQTATAVSTTSPPVATNYAANVAAVTSIAPPSTTISSGTSTPTSTSIGLTSASTTSSTKQSPEMVEMLIIVGLTIGAVILLFWIWRRYVSVSEYCPHIDCNHSKVRKNWDGMIRRIKIMAIMAAQGPGHRELDAEKGLRPVTPITSNIMESEREAEIAATRRQRFEEAMRNRESRRASKRTILAELEGDFSLSESSAPPMPPMPTEIDLEKRDQVPEFQIKRKTMVGQGQSGVVVKWRGAAVIVAVGKKGHGASSSRVINERDLPPIPFNRMSDEDDFSPILSILYVKRESDDSDDVISDCHCGLDDPSSEEQSRFDYPTSSRDEIVERSRLDDATPPSPSSEVESKGKGKESEIDQREEGNGLELDQREEAKRVREERKERLRHKRNQLSVQRKGVGSAGLKGGLGSAGKNPATTPWEFVS